MQPSQIDLPAASFIPASPPQEPLMQRLEKITPNSHRGQGDGEDGDGDKQAGHEI